jgi:hypothetical protein
MSDVQAPIASTIESDDLAVDAENERRLALLREENRALTDCLGQLQREKAAAEEELGRVTAIVRGIWPSIRYRRTRATRRALTDEQVVLNHVINTLLPIIPESERA